MTDDAPDPSEVDALGANEGVYERDSDGNLRPLDDWDMIQWGGEWHKVRFYPVPTGDQHRFEAMGEDVDIEEFADVLDEKVHTPDRTAQEWLDTDPRQTIAVLNALVERATGDEPDSEFHEEVREELDQRATAGAGN